MRHYYAPLRSLKWRQPIHFNFHKRLPSIFWLCLSLLSIITHSIRHRSLEEEYYQRKLNLAKLESKFEILQPGPQSASPAPFTTLTRTDFRRKLQPNLESVPSSPFALVSKQQFVVTRPQPQQSRNDHNQLLKNVKKVSTAATSTAAEQEKNPSKRLQKNHFATKQNAPPQQSTSQCSLVGTYELSANDFDFFTTATILVEDFLSDKAIFNSKCRQTSEQQLATSNTIFSNHPNISTKDNLSVFGPSEQSPASSSLNSASSGGFFAGPNRENATVAKFSGALVSSLYITANRWKGRNASSIIADIRNQYVCQLSTHSRYCEQHGYSCYLFIGGDSGIMSSGVNLTQQLQVFRKMFTIRNFSTVLPPGIAPHWMKLIAIRDLLPEHSWVLYLDLDTIISGDIALSQSVDEVVFNRSSSFHSISVVVPTSADFEWNTDTILIRNTAYGRAFANHAWALRNYCPDCVEEQGAILIAMHHAFLHEVVMIRKQLRRLLVKNGILTSVLTTRTGQSATSNIAYTAPSSPSHFQSRLLSLLPHPILHDSHLIQMESYPKGAPPVRCCEPIRFCHFPKGKKGRRNPKPSVKLQGCVRNWQKIFIPLLDRATSINLITNITGATYPENIKMFAGLRGRLHLQHPVKDMNCELKEKLYS